MSRKRRLLSCLKIVAVASVLTVGILEAAETGVTSHSGSPLEIPKSLQGNPNIEFGNPGGHGRLLVKKHYVIMYLDDLKIPEWVAYRLTKEDMLGEARRSNDFRPDPDLPIGSRAELTDYRRSGLHRGHMAPAGDFKRSDEAMSETFFLSNIVPQYPAFNQGIWERLVEQVRLLALRDGMIWVITGSLFLDEHGKRIEPTEYIGPGNVAIPTHFYKAILSEHPDGTHEMFAFIIENRSTKMHGTPKDYMVRVRDIENVSGLNFFNLLPDEEEAKLEESVGTNWPEK